MNITYVNDIVEGFENNFVGIEWKRHPEYAGVWLKELLGLAESNNVFRSLMVKVESGCELFEHIHDNNWEMHEVIAGNGVARIEGIKQKYTPGAVAVIEKGLKHSVQAGDEGIVLLAKFF